MNKGGLQKFTSSPWFVYVIVGLVVILDQLTKYIVKSSMFLYQSENVIGDFFKLTYIENPGMAFGIQFESKVLFTVLSILAAIVVFIYLIRMPHEKLLFRISLALIFGGAIGNLIDRLLYGRVVDFLDVEFFDISIPAFSLLFWDFPGYVMTRWPVFNIADSAVTCGMILLTWLILFQKSAVNQEAPTEA
jgi:signal peptidase II